MRMIGQGSNSLDPQDLVVKRPVSQHCAKIYIQIKLKAVCKKMWLNTIKTKGKVNKEQIYGSYMSYSVSVQDLRVQSCHPLQTARQECRTYIVGHMPPTLDVTHSILFDIRKRRATSTVRLSFYS